MSLGNEMANDLDGGRIPKNRNNELKQFFGACGRTSDCCTSYTEEPSPIIDLLIKKSRDPQAHRTC